MKGSCLCGEIVYEAEKLASDIVHCACTTCRKSHSAAFNTAAAVDSHKFKWISGEHLLKFYKSSPGKYRYFCGNCGTQLIKKVDGRDQIVLRVATLDEDPGKIPKAIIWTTDSVPWLSYEQQIPKFEEWEIK